MEKLSAHAAQNTRQDWCNFGYFYAVDDTAKEWHLHGSVSGLLKLAHSLEAYAANPANAGISQHEHLGPHMYLVLTTWPTAKLDGHGVFGKASDLLRLASIVRRYLANASAGQVLRMRQEYTPSAEYTLCLHVHHDGFDPASLDPQLAG
jgi:hypothetical protein